MVNQKTVAIYCRVSTNEQAEEGYSIGEQERLLIEYCEKNNYKVYRVYAERGISGKDIKHRPALNELLQDASDKRFNLVMSWKINRLSRKLLDAISIVDYLDKYGVTYRSYSEPFESDTPAGKMQFQMMALIGEFERGTIAQNVKMGMCAKARAGEWCGGQAMLGYDWELIEHADKHGRKKSRLVVNHKEAEIVRRIYQEYASGKGYKAIVNQLNKEGYKTKRGNHFSVGPLRDILLNPVYIGKVRYNVRKDWNEKRRRNKNSNPIIVEGQHDSIISKELWQQVQLIMDTKKGKPSRVYDGEYPLTGIMRCPECGAGMVISRTVNRLKSGEKKQLTYYACGAWKNKGIAVCHSNAIRVEKANEVVYSELEKVINNETILKRLLQKVNNRNKKKLDSANKIIKKCSSELEKAQARKEKIFKAYEEDLITSDELIERKEVIGAEIEDIEKRREDALLLLQGRNKEQISHEYVQGILQNFSRVLSSAEIDRALKKQLLHMLIAEITIDKNREIDSIKLRFNEELIRFLSDRQGEAQKESASLFFIHKSHVPSSMELQLVI